MSLDSASIVPPKQREENYENCTKFFNRIWRFSGAPETCSISLFKAVFRTAASFALLSPEACAILCSEASGNLLLESSDSTWVPPEASTEISDPLLPESLDSTWALPEVSWKRSGNLLLESSDSAWVPPEDFYKVLRQSAGIGALRSGDGSTGELL